MLSRLVRNVTRNGSRFKSIAQSTNANVGTATKIITATKTTSRTFSTTIITARTRIINQTLSSFTFNGTTCSTAKRCLSTNHENDPHHILGVAVECTHEEAKDSYRQLFHISRQKNNNKNMLELQYAWNQYENPPKKLKKYTLSTKKEASYPKCIRHVSHPRPSHIGSNSNSWISDAPNMLTNFQTFQINKTIDYLQRHTFAEVAVVCIEEIDNHTYGSGTGKYATFSDELMNLWGVGRKGYNDGCLIILFREGRRIEIRTGDGMRKLLPDQWLQNLQQEKMLPTFRRNEHGDGMLLAVMEICYKIHVGTDTSTQSRQDFQRQILLEDSALELEHDRKKDEDEANNKETINNDLKKTTTPSKNEDLKIRKGYRKPKHDGLFGGGTSKSARLSQVWRKPKQTDKNEEKKKSGGHDGKYKQWGNYEQWWDNNSTFVYMGSFASLLGSLFYISSRKKNQCDGCGMQMIIDESFSKKEKLSTCEFLEDAIGSVKYYPLICEDCGKRRIRKERKFLTAYSTCSKCKCTSDYTLSRVTTQYATYDSEGKRKIVKKCKHCGERHTRYETIARKVRPTSRSTGGSSGGGSSGGGGFGGGSSSGGGSGSSWLTDACNANE